MMTKRRWMFFSESGVPMNKVEFNKGINVVNELSSWTHLDGSLFLGISNDKLLTDTDFALFREWGLDHVRVMVDFTVIMEVTRPYAWKESGWTLVEETIRMAERNGVGVVLDLHSTLGSEFQEGGSCGGVKNELLSNPEQQEVFYRIWHEFSRRCAGTEDFVAFEILNEVTFDGGVGWNTVALNTIEIIRSYSKERRIILGGVWWNSPRGLLLLPVDELKDDKNIIFNFHYYAPFFFTHQILEMTLPMAVEHAAYGGVRVSYPGRDPGNPEVYADKEYLKEHLKEVYEFRAKYPDLPLYCGEFGVNQYVHGTSRLNWQKDIFELLKENNVKICYFTYKWPGWGIMDVYNPAIYDKGVAELLKQY